MISKLDSSGYENLKGEKIKLEPELTPWPIKPPRASNINICSTLGSCFFLFPFLLLFYIQLQSLSSEFHSRSISSGRKSIKEIMVISGINLKEYWVSKVVYFTFIPSLIMSIEMTILGYIFKIELFEKTDFFLMFVLFLLTSFCMGCYAILLSMRVKSFAKVQR